MPPRRLFRATNELSRTSEAPARTLVVENEARP